MKKVSYTRRLLALSLLLLLAAGAMPVEADITIQNMSLTGFPDASPYTKDAYGNWIDQSGKFINVTRGLSSLGDVGARVIGVSLSIPGELEEFELEIFDGDMGGLFDRLPSSGAPDQLTFKLYADPNLVGNTSGDPLYSWLSGDMPDNDWCQLNPNYDPDDPTTPVCDAAKRIPQAAAAHNGTQYHYHLVVEWNTTGNDNEQNVFKVRVRGTPFLRASSIVGFEGFGCNPEAPACTPYTNYDGTFEFLFVLPAPAAMIELWDGDFDLVVDTDDPNSPDFPPFPYSPATQAQGARRGRPADDQQYSATKPNWMYYLVSPNVSYEVASADGSVFVKNMDPSGDREWEVFQIAAGQADPPVQNPDVAVDGLKQLPAGTYTWTIRGLDYWNTIFLYVDYDLFATLPSIGNTVWLDTNEDGFWDQAAGEPGIKDVLVNLWLDKGEIGVIDPGDERVATTTTDATGYYVFRNVGIAVAGNTYYIVQIDPSNFAADGPLEGMAQTADRSGEAGDHYNRKNPWPVIMPPVNISYVRADFGYYLQAGSQECNLALTKGCLIQEPPADVECRAAIAATTLRYTGPPVSNATVTLTGMRNGRAVYKNVSLVSGVTVLTSHDQNGWTIDGSPMLGAKTTIVVKNNDTGTEYKEIIHTSCSQPYIAGEPAPLDGQSPNPPGSASGDPSPTWVVESFTDKEGGYYSVPQPPVPSTHCQVDPGEVVTYEYTVTNNGNTTVTDILLTDDPLGPISGGFDLGAGESVTFQRTAEITMTTVNTATVSGYLDGLTCTARASALVTVREQPEGGEGCTPGYWKQKQHFDSWVGYNTTDKFEVVFGVPGYYGKKGADTTLLQALGKGGGGKAALGRHATAALLNAANPDVSYAYTVDRIIAMVQEAYRTGQYEAAKDLLEAENELGCPLN